MPFTIIAAVAKNNCIGIKNKLPWNLPEDLKHFKELTMGNTVLMGQKTFESILGYLGKPLPGRKTVVVSNDPNFTAQSDVRIFRSLDDIFTQLSDENVFICGGASIYAQTINRMDTLYITHVDLIVDGDVFFPEIDKNIWHEAEHENHDGFSFVTYKK